MMMMMMMMLMIIIMIMMMMKNENDHNSANFEGRASRICMVVAIYNTYQ